MWARRKEEWSIRAGKPQCTATAGLGLGTGRDGKGGTRQRIGGNVDAADHNALSARLHECVKCVSIRRPLEGRGRAKMEAGGHGSSLPLGGIGPALLGLSSVNFQVVYKQTAFAANRQRHVSILSSKRVASQSLVLEGGHGL